MPLKVERSKTGKIESKGKKGPSKLSQFGTKMLEHDSFNYTFQMKLDKGITGLTTVSGLCLTLLLGLVMVSFALQKSWAMFTKKYIDIKTSSTMNYYDHAHVFDAEQGLEVAIGFTAYDNNREVILDKSIGELAFIAYEWGEDEAGNVFVKRERIPSYQCTKDELGLGSSDSESRFYPAYATHQFSLEKIQKKFRCIDKENMYIYGDWNSKRARVIDM